MTSSDTSNVLPEADAAERLAATSAGNRERTRPGPSRAAGTRSGTGADPAHRPRRRRRSRFPRRLQEPPLAGISHHSRPAAGCGQRNPRGLGQPNPSRRSRANGQAFPRCPCRPRARTIPPTYRIVRPSDGQTRWIDVVAKIERDGDGRALRLVGAHIDVTDRMLAQEKLRESEERFRLIADSAPVPIWVTKLDRTRSFANQAYVDFLGLPFEEAIVFDWRKVLHPDDLPRIVQESIAGEASLKPFVLEARYQQRRRRMALAALGIPAALGPDRQAHRLHRRRPRHHRRQAGRERSAPAERDPGIADHRANRATGIQRSPDARDPRDQPSVSGAAQPARRPAVCQQDRAGRHPRRGQRRARQAVLGHAVVFRRPKACATSSAMPSSP